MTAGQVALWEGLGTAIMMVVGTSASANSTLRMTSGHRAGPLMPAISWAFAVFAGASVAHPTGGHLNPAVTLADVLSGKLTPGQSVPYVVGQLAGALVGCTLTYLAFKKQFDTHHDPAEFRGIFCTAPMIRSYGWNVATEAIATFVLVTFVLLNPAANDALGYAAVAFVVLAIGTSLGGPTGWALNPARDLGARIAFVLLPMRGKSHADWAYAWVPVVGPLLGATAASALAAALV